MNIMAVGGFCVWNMFYLSLMSSFYTINCFPLFAEKYVYVHKMCLPNLGSPNKDGICFIYLCLYNYL